MSGGSGANNSWTILTSESAAEPLKPSADGTEELLLASGSAEKQPDSGAEPAEGRPLEAAGGEAEELTSDTNGNQHTSLTAALSADAVVASSASFPSDTDALSQSEGLPEGPTLSAHDPDLFSDSYSHITPSPDEPSATQLSIETLGGAEPAQEEQRLSREASARHLSDERETHDGAEPETCGRTSDAGKPAESPAELQVGEQKTAEEARRRRSLLAALERIGRTEEEEEKEEELQRPQRNEESGFTVNKCILGAVILLGIGTVFFSGSDFNTRELRDAELPTKQDDWLNPEALPLDHADNTELLNLAKGNEQISVLNAQLQAQKEQLKVAQGQAAEGAKERLRWEEVERENSRLKKEVASLAVLHKENERMKRELESVRALQKELETLRATLTESKHPAAPKAAQRSTTPHSSGQPEDSVPDSADGQPKMEKSKEVKEKKKKEEKVKEKSEWKDKREKRETKDEGKTEWKKEQLDSGKFDKEKYNRDKQKRSSDEPKQKEEWKKEKAGRGDEGKPWKNREGSKEWRENNERKEWNEEKDRKKSKHREVSDGKHWQGKKEEKRDWEVRKEHGEKHRGKEEWKGESKWRKGKDEFKEQWETKERKKDKDQSRNGKENGKDGKWEKEKKKPWEESRNQGRHGKERDGRMWKGDNGKSDGEGKRKDERKQHENKWRSQNDKFEEAQKRKGEGWKSRGDEEDKEWKRKDERGKEKKKEQQQKKNWKRGEDADTSSSHRKKGESSSSHGHQGAHLWGERKPAHTHRQRPSPGQPEYWDRQRGRLLHNSRPLAAECGSAEACARAEGLRPVTAPEFHAVLQTYLARAGELGADAAAAEQLSELTAEFFTAEGDGGGVFAHDRLNFRDFAEDVGDVLEDLVEMEEDGESSALEDEMEEFQRDVVTRFSLPGAAEESSRAGA